MKVEITGIKEFQTKISKLFSLTSDLRPLWEVFYSDILKDEKRIFQLQNKGEYKGKYADLKETTKKAKIRAGVSAYPILVFSGKLASSLLNRSDADNIVDITKTKFTYGTRNPYAFFLHKGTDFMPARPLWFVGEEENPAQWKRFNRYIEAFLKKAVKGAFRGTV